MNSDVSTLQSIATTLKNEPLASQRELAKNAGMSIGLMNAVLKRFVERGWIMLTNVNLRKLSYAVTPAGIAELSARSQKFAKWIFAIANKYNEILCNLVLAAKKDGKSKLILYGKSYIKFLLEYACQTLNMEFEEKDVMESLVENAFCVVGELNAENEIIRLTDAGAVNLLDLLNECE